MAVTYRTTIAAYAVGRRVNLDEFSTLTKTAEAGLNFGVTVMPGTGADTVSYSTPDRPNVLAHGSEVSCRSGNATLK